MYCKVCLTYCTWNLEWTDMTEMTEMAVSTFEAEQRVVIGPAVKYQTMGKCGDM